MTGSAPRTPEHPGCVVGIAVGMLAIALPLLALLGMRGEVLEPGAALGELVAAGELPFGLVPREAAVLPGGLRVVRLAREGYEAEPPPKESERPKPQDAAPPPPRDEAPKRPPLVGSTAPPEVFLVRYGSPTAAARAFMGEARGGDGGRRGPMPPSFGGGPVLMDNGDLPWGDLLVGFRHERRLLPGQTRDELRVNLSTPGRFVVLSARWPADHAADKEKVVELLGALAPLPPPRGEEPARP